MSNIPIEAGIAWQAGAFDGERKAVTVDGHTWYRHDHPEVKKAHDQHLKRLMRERDGWRQEAAIARKELDTLREQMDLRTLHQKADCWYWQGDGDDHPESFSNAMAIVIRGDQLRALIAGSTR